MKSRFQLVDEMHTKLKGYNMERIMRGLQPIEELFNFQVKKGNEIGNDELGIAMIWERNTELNETFIRIPDFVNYFFSRDDSNSGISVRAHECNKKVEKIKFLGKTSVGNSALNGFNNLRKIDFDNVDYLGEDALGNTAIEEIKTKAEYIGGGCFVNCTKLKNAEFNGEKVYMCHVSFLRCLTLETVKFNCREVITERYIADKDKILFDLSGVIDLQCSGSLLDEAPYSLEVNDRATYYIKTSMENHTRLVNELREHANICDISPRIDMGKNVYEVTQKYVGRV